MPSQFACPSGIAGRVVGRLMAVANAELNRLAVEALDPRWGESVLEIGFGPGIALEEIVSRIGNGFVAGVDPSDTMLSQASHRLHALVGSGRVELRRATISAIPYEDARFDRALSVHTIYFWPDPSHDVREVRRVLKTGGLLVLGFRAAPGPDGMLQVYGRADRPYVLDVGGWLRDAGFDDLRTRTREVRLGFRKVKGVVLSAQAV